MENLNRERATWNSEARGIAVKCRELVMIVSVLPKNVNIHKRLTFSAFMVADVTMSFKSRLLDKTGRSKI